MNKLLSIICGREVYALRHDWTVLEAVRYMTEKRVGAAAVLNGEAVVGVFSERDLMTRVVAAGIAADKTRVSDVMTRNIVSCDPEETLEEGLQKMQQAKCRHLPIIEKGRLINFVSMRDLMQVEIEEMDLEIKLMNEYLYSVPASVEH